MEEPTLDGKTLEQWKQEASNDYEMTTEDLEQLGVIQNNVNENIPNEEVQAQVLDKDDNEENNNYEKLSLMESWKDAFTSIGVEASHLYTPRPYELQYKSKTHFGENMKLLTRYGTSYGVTAFALASVAAALPVSAPLAAGAAAAVGGVKLAKTLKTALGMTPLIKTSVNASKLSKAASFLINKTTENWFANAVSAGIVARPEEESFLFFNPENMTETQGKLAAAAEASALNPVFNIAFAPIGRILSKLKTNKQSLEQTAVDLLHIDKIENTSGLHQAVKTLYERSTQTNEEFGQLLLDNIHPQNLGAAKELANFIENGQEPFIKEDGTFCLKVEKWQDAANVTPDELKEQLKLRDTELAEKAAKEETGEIVREGDSAISLMDSAVKETWVNRNWIDGGKKSLLDKNGEVSQTQAQRIAELYRDKFKIDNKIKVEVIENLTDTNNPLLKIDGNTQAANYLGKKSGKIKDITIRIDKNAKNPHAALRSELEHARDLAKGEVPDQTKKHFARYEGLNEAEVSIPYVQKKAANAQMKKSLEGYELKETNSNTFGIQAADEEPYTMATLTNKKGEQVANLRYAVQKDGTLLIEDMQNKGKEKAAARKLVAKLLMSKPNTKLNWTAASEASVSSFNYFKKEYPELVSHIDFYNGIDWSTDFSYNNHKGVNNDKKNVPNIRQTQEKQQAGRSTGNTYPSSEINNKNVQGSNKQSLRAGDRENGRNLQKGVFEGMGNEPVSSNSTETRPPAKSVNDTIDDITKGKTTLEKPAVIDGIVNQVRELNPEISGVTHASIQKDGEALGIKYTDIVNGDTSYLDELLLKEDLTKADDLVRKQLAAVKIFQPIYEKYKQLPDDIDVDTLAYYTETLDYLTNYIKGISSSAGRGLNAQKVIIDNLSIIDKRLSEFTKRGVHDFCNKLYPILQDIINLNFTRGAKVPTQAEIRKKVLKAISKFDDNGSLVKALSFSSTYRKDLYSLIDKYCAKKSFTKEELAKSLKNITLHEQLKQAKKLAQVAPDIRGGLGTIAQLNSKLSNYVVTNYLSSPVTPVKNIFSGFANMITFPVEKIVGGLAGFNGVTLREGLRQSVLWTQYLKEALDLSLNAFSSGNITMATTEEGRALTNSIYHPLMQGGKFSGEVDILKGINNFFTIIPRTIGASDIFFKQLNYRSIVRSRAIEAAEQYALENGFKHDREAIGELANNFFEQSFDKKTGMPLDLDAYYECLQQAYQNSLDGRMRDPLTGAILQMGEASLWQKGSDLVNKAANKCFILKMLSPFITTSSNIAELRMQHTLFSGKTLKAIAQGGEARAKALGKVILGTLGTTFFYTQALQGRITGSPPKDPKERQALYETGWRPYSIRVGNNFISYQGIEPLQGMLTFAADAAYFTTRINDPQLHDKVSMALAGVVRTFFDMIDTAQFRQSFGTLNTLLDGNTGQGAQRAFSDLAKSLIPMETGIRYITSLNGASPMKTNTNKDTGDNFKGYLKAVGLNILNDIFNTKLGDYRRDVFGERQDAWYTATLVRTTEDRASYMDCYEEMERLAEYGFSPTELGKTISSDLQKDYTFFKDDETGRSAYDYMLEALTEVKLNNKSLQEAVSDLIKSDEYQQLPDGITALKEYAKYTSTDNTKVNALNKIFRRYYKAAKAKMLENTQDIDFKDLNGNSFKEARQAAFIERTREIEVLHSPTLDEIASFD